MQRLERLALRQQHQQRIHAPARHVLSGQHAAGLESQDAVTPGQLSKQRMSGAKML